MRSSVGRFSCLSKQPLAVMRSSGRSTIYAYRSWTAASSGTGRLLKMLSARPENQMLVGIDRVSAMLDVARRRIGQRALLLQADAGELPLGDAKFQLVVSINARHYFPDADAALREIRRVVSPIGNIIITDWCRDYYWMKLLNRILPGTHHAHAHTFNTIELTQSPHQAGFKVTRVSRRKIACFWGLMSVHAVPN